MKIQERKEDTRRKIQLGGLVKKAGLENESTAILYGMLLEAAENLSSNDAEKIRTRWKIKGDLAFTREQK
ncbi:MAG: conjugal transfer protein TraD [Legionellales bacterium]|nr:conjugal transfer protein TraD [Legionellales bacterium]